MGVDILSVIQEHTSAFSKGQKQIARYIMQSYDKAAFMTASQLGRTAGVSESTVIRFATELGYDGYPCLQKAMQEMVRNRLSTAQHAGTENDRLAEKDVVSMIIQNDMELLRRTDETVSRVEFQNAVDAVLHAKRIYIIGTREASVLARFLGHYLNYIFSDVRTITASGAAEVLEKIVDVNSEDAVIAFSFPRYISSTVRAAEYCRAAGASMIAVTDNAASPLARCADHVICAQNASVSFVNSLAAPLCVANALITAVAARREKELHRTADALEHIWGEYRVYERAEQDER